MNRPGYSPCDRCGYDPAPMTPFVGDKVAHLCYSCWEKYKQEKADEAAQHQEIETRFMEVLRGM